MERCMEEADMGKAEALHSAISKRKFLLKEVVDRLENKYKNDLEEERVRGGGYAQGYYSAQLQACRLNEII